MAIEHTTIKKDGYETINLTRGRAIRKKCLECSGWSFNEVKLCTCYDCALYPYRLGKPDESRVGVMPKF